MRRMGRLASALLVESRVCVAFASRLRAWGATGARVGAERGTREVAIATTSAVRNAACVHRTAYALPEHAEPLFMKLQVIGEFGVH